MDTRAYQYWGPEGYLAEKGMIPMSAEERAEFKGNVAGLKPFDCSVLEK